MIRLLLALLVASCLPCWCGSRWIFEPNLGQTDPEVMFLGHGGSASAWVANGEIVISTLRVRFPGSNRHPVVEGADPLPGKTNYLRRTNSRRGISQFGRVRYRELYPGIDLELYGNPDGLEYDFVVSPGANPQTIELHFDGARSLSLDRRGNLVISVEGGEVLQRRPVAYQGRGVERTEVACGYLVEEGNRVQLTLGPYDRTAPLTIDPVVAFSTTLGKSGDYGEAIAVDRDGNVYVTGSARSTDFPTTPGAYARTRKGATDDCAFNVMLPAFCTDVFVTKMNSQGNILYSTYIGGAQVDAAHGIAVDAAGNAYVTGSTVSSDFPVTPGAFQGAFRGGVCTYDPMPGPPITYPCSDAFALKLNPSGSALVYSTYLAGNGSDWGIAVFADGQGSATVVGNTASTDFPSAPSRLANPPGVFVARLDASGGALLRTTFLSNAAASGAAADTATGEVYITGTTNSPDFPYTPGAFQGPSASGEPFAADAYAAKLSATGGILYAARIGSVRSLVSSSIAVDSQGQALISGMTESDSFPVTGSLPGTRSFSGRDLFLTKLDAQGARLVYSYRIGGRREDRGRALGFGRDCSTYVLGQSESTDFPVTAGAILPCAKGSAATQWTAAESGLVLLKLDGSGSALLHSTRLESNRPYLSDRLAMAVAEDGSVWVTGQDVVVAKVDFSKNPGLSVACVAGAASLLSAPVSPGELVAIFGSGIGPGVPAWLTLGSDGRVSTELGGVRVLFDGIPAPLSYVHANQINAVVPFGVSGRTTTQVEVVYQGRRTAPVAVPVADVAPAVFTLDMSGVGQGAILNEDGAVNGPDNPAPEGSTIAVWATGAGLLDASVSDGQVTQAPYSKPRLPVKAQINGMDQEVTYAGSAPGLVAGVLQVNIKIAFATKRQADAMSFAVGDKWSPSVSLSIK